MVRVSTNHFRLPWFVSSQTIQMSEPSSNLSLPPSSSWFLATRTIAAVVCAFTNHCVRFKTPYTWVLKIQNSFHSFHNTVLMNMYTHTGRLPVANALPTDWHVYTSAFVKPLF